MTNASVKNMFAALFVVFAFTLSVGAFAGTAHAQYEDYSGDNFGYLGGSSVDTGWYDTGSSYTPDTGWYDTGSSYTPDTGWYDTGSSYTPDTGWYDTGSSYTPDTGWYDTGSSYTPNSTNDTVDTVDTYDTYSTSPSYSASQPYYSSGCNCYSSSPNYSTGSSYASVLPTAARQAIYSYVPAAAQQYIPSYVYQPSQPQQPKQPTYTTTAAPANNTNTNTNVPTNTSTNTNTPIATASNAPITNTNTAATGAITNTFAPVINVGSSGSTQHPVDYQFPRPVCTIYSNNNGSYNYNNSTSLTWTSQNATTAYISPNVGNVNVNGSTNVYTNGYTTYTLTVTGPGGSATCQTAASYAPSYIAPTYTNYPTTSPAPYVSLSQIPYTGFDYGPIGNALYWTAILSFAVAAGYLLVYGMPKMALAGFAARKNQNTFASNDVAEVFKSNLVTSTDVAIETPEVEESINAFALPVATNSQAGVTSDAMIIDRSNGTPRIVIARA